jgi:hypothetical protein
VLQLRGSLTPESLASLDSVSWVGEYRTEWKLDPEFGLRVFESAERREMAERGEHAVIVTLFADRAKDPVLQQIRTMDGAQIHYSEEVSGNETIAATGACSVVWMRTSTACATCSTTVRTHRIRPRPSPRRSSTRSSRRGRTVSAGSLQPTCPGSSAT